MSEELSLVERLRKERRVREWDEVARCDVVAIRPINPDGPEAADRLEALEGALRGLVDEFGGSLGLLESRRRELIEAARNILSRSQDNER
jgi:hypothetical protein